MKLQKRVKKTLQILATFFFILSLSDLAYSAGGDGGIPWSMIKAQAFNFTLLLILLFYFLKDPIKNYFKDRHSLYYKDLKDAELAKKEAESVKKDLENRLANLKQTEQSSIEQAEKDAAELKKMKQEEANQVVDRMKTEAEKSVQMELSRLKNKVRLDMLEKSIERSKQSIDQKIEGEDQVRLQGEFISKIQVVR